MTGEKARREARNASHVDRYRTSSTIASGRWPNTAAQHRAHPCLELADLERLDEVVVGPGAEAGDLVVERVAGGEHQ